MVLSKSLLFGHTFLICKMLKVHLVWKLLCSTSRIVLLSSLQATAILGEKQEKLLVVLYQNNSMKIPKVL